MRPLKFGLIAALALAALAPAGVSSQSRDAGVTEAQRKAGMAEAPAIAQASGITCQIADARLIGKVDDKKAKVSKSYYEIDCDQGLGYVIEATNGQKSGVYSCVEASQPTADGKENSLACKLPGNADTTAAVAQLAQKAGVACPVSKIRSIGQSPTNTFFEVLCQDQSGYVLQAGAPPLPTGEVQATNCFLYDEANTNIKCELVDKAARLAVVDTLAQQAANGCQVKDRRYILTSKDNSNYFEAACQDGKGYVFKVDASGKLAQTLACAQADHVGGGCTMTDSRQAKTEQAALYTRLAKAAGKNCEVTGYGALPGKAGEDVVELVCNNAPGGIGVFTASGGKVYDCGKALIAGYRCSLNKGDTGATAFTADLKKLGKASCTAKDVRLVGKTSDGSTYVEVNCTDGLAGYMIQYSGVDAPKEAIGCAFAKGIAGGCKLPGNAG